MIPDTSCQKPEIKFDFENLNVYQKALDFIDEIFQIVRDLPKEYRFSIGDNMIRAALSVANNLAEGQKAMIRVFLGKKGIDISELHQIRLVSASPFSLFLRDKHSYPTNST